MSNSQLPHSVRRILVRSPNWIGDQILAYPFFYYLRRAYPLAYIAAVCPSWVESIQFRALVNEVIVIPEPLESTVRSKLEAIERGAKTAKEAASKNGGWDLGITLPNSLSSAWFLFRAGAKRRRGYATEGRGLILNDTVKFPKGPEIIHRSEAYVRLLADAELLLKKPVKEFWGLPPENENDPADEGVPGVLKSFVPSLEWPDATVTEAPESKYWVLAPGSNAVSRQWPVEYFLKLARLISAETGLTGVVVGGPSETDLARRLCEEKSLKLKDLTARGSVAGLWKLFQGASFAVANDSGLAHVASLCGSRTQIVWGAGEPRRTEPLGPGRIRISLHPVDCWPCEKNTCSQPTGRKLECLRGIDPEKVWEDMKKHLLPKDPAKDFNDSTHESKRL